MIFSFEHQWRGNADAHLHFASLRRDWKTLDENAIASGSCNEHRITSLRDHLLVSLPRLISAGESRLTLLTTDPERQTRHKAAGRKLNLRARFLLTDGIVLEVERPFEVTESRVGVG